MCDDGSPVHHFDLYRLSGPADFKNLALDQSFTSAVSLIEWSERLQLATPPCRLDVRIHAAKPVSESQTSRPSLSCPHLSFTCPSAPQWLVVSQSIAFVATGGAIDVRAGTAHGRHPPAAGGGAGKQDSAGALPPH